MANLGMLRRTLVMTLLALGAPRLALACPVCFGRSDSPLAIATNLGVLAMLGVVVAVLGGFAAFMVYLVRRARVTDETPGAQGAEGAVRC